MNLIQAARERQAAAVQHTTYIVGDLSEAGYLLKYGNPEEQSEAGRILAEAQHA